MIISSLSFHIPYRIWPTPVELKPSAATAMGNNNDIWSLLDWSADKELEDRRRQLNLGVYPYLYGHEQLVWPVLIPGLPRQNAAFNMNSWTAHIITQEFEQSGFFVNF
jgi:hypothetical protein